jgi:hypothetical protein
VTLRLSLLSLAALGGAFLIATAPAAATSPRELREMRCDMLEQQRGGRMITIEAPNLHVLAQTAGGQAFAPVIPQGIAAISCGRTSVIPAAWDDRVIVLGLPLFIAEVGSLNRLGVLEIDNGRYRFRFLHGEARPDEQAQIDERLQVYQSRFDAAQRRSQ